MVLNDDGSFTYMPSANYSGTDSFTYKANDGLLDSNVATVTIVVDPVNDAPDADAGGPYTISEGDWLLLDASGSTDIEADTLSFSWMSMVMASLATPAARHRHCLLRNWPVWALTATTPSASLFALMTATAV